MKVTVTLHISEIVYDVQNKTYLTGRSRADGSNHERVAAMQANDDEENANQVMRSIGTALGTLTTHLADYLPDTTDTADNALPDASGRVELQLTVPDNFNQAALRGMAEAAHAYVTACAVADWFTITDKADADDYRRLAADALARLTDAMCRRRRPGRPVLQRSVPPIA